MSAYACTQQSITDDWHAKVVLYRVGVFIIIDFCCYYYYVVLLL